MNNLMMKSPLIPVALLAAISLGGCSLLKKQEASTVNSQDALPLFPVTTQTPVDISIDGHWFMRTVGSMKLSGFDEEWPFLEFVPTEARFYGNNGCNIINGSYHLGPKQELRLSEVAATMRLCPSDSLEYPVAHALDAVRSYSVSTAPDGSTILSLHNADNLTVMTLRKSDIDFLNGPWRVKSINGTEVENPDCRLIFDVAEGTVSGDTGCNILNGRLTREPSVSGSLGFSHLATTRMACPDMATEQSLLIALEEVTAARHSGKSVDLLNSAGDVIIHLTQLSKSDL